jgi:tetratricopeptide (TPR) repeat protein
LQVFEKAVQLQPDVSSWKNLGNVLFELRRADLALRAYRQVLDLDPHDWDAACRSGYLHYQAGQLEQALAYFDICDRVRPNHAATLYMRSVFLIGLGRLEQAIAEGKRAHVLDPGNADTCNNIGAAFRGLHRHEEALPWFDRALERRPGFDSALYNKAHSLAKLRRIKDALAVCDRLMAVRGPGSAITDLQWADLLVELGRYEDALAVLDQCDKRQPNSAPALQLRAACLQGLK